MRKLTIAFVTVLVSLMVLSYVNRYVVRSVWAQGVPTTVPITFPGGSPGCTVLIAASAGRATYIDNGILSIPSAGTGLAVQFLASTAGTANVACPTGVTQTALTGFYVGAQSGTNGTNNTIYAFGPSSAIVTPTGQGISATVSGLTAGTPVSGHLTFRQQ